MDPVTTFLEQCRTDVDTTLAARLAVSEAGSTRLLDAMKYSVLGGGKRVRPALCLAAAVAVGQSGEAAIVPACATELIHAYSLIHDDLPAMDNDELRRGRPTTHIAFDEATAILAGDALQTLAFDWLADAPMVDDQTRLAMVRELAKGSGHLGMVGGQAIDLESVGKHLSIEHLESMHRHKTGALIEASHDENGIIWPEGVTPFHVGIVNLKQGDAACDAACEDLYKAFTAKGLEPLYDDREERAGAKFATMDLIGLPWRITVGPRGLKNGVVELTSRKTGVSEELSAQDALARVAEIYGLHPG